ncbi:FAD-dependent oxidoreductase [Mobilicoccus caccae]|uniref:D-amino-acid oxidase n=1 Tax=Mobilicoccus caccae TaxID=1859295 RepID=A0ABQ6IN42_9MICO|nr:FAD-dependent oxidoreductase [Mobilicoccus caccae]GMA39323.1 amino acid oxidase [Mobilicoccus caccae]
MERVIVVGAGVIGLTCAVRLLEAGHEVDILARDLPEETTSAVSAALWYPYRAAPEARVAAWGGAAFEAFARIAEENTSAGVRMRRGVELLGHDAVVPGWTGAVREFARLTDVPSPYVSGWRFTTPVADMSVYLPWLRARVDELGGTVTRMALGHLPRPEKGVVVNASGLGARRLADDSSVTPLRGQVVLVEQFGLEQWSLEDSVPTYVVPRERTVVVGGTAEEGEWSTQPEKDRARGLLDRAHDLLLRTGDPATADRLRRAEIVGHRVGLRPARPQVRLEEEHLDGVRVVHCYGHGGAGMTLSWGCADEVVTLVGG